MAYHGLYPVMKSLLEQIPQPKVLEIGVDRGVTFLTLFHFLTLVHKEFLLEGVDIRFDETTKIMMDNFAVLYETQVAKFYLENSLKFLENNKEKKYNLVLLDGDHNYFTVQKELELLHEVANENAMIICDDYFGRWSERDLFYSTRETHSKIKEATPVVQTEKHGVKAAVDEFLQLHPEWKFKYASGEPVILTRGSISIQ